MKKTFILSAVSLTASLTAALLLTGCGTVSLINSDADNTDTTDLPAETSTTADTTTNTTTTTTTTSTESTTTTTTTTTETTTTTTTTTAPPVTWQSAYRTFLTDYRTTAEFSEETMWDLYDIDGDGTPELLLSPNTAHASGIRFYTFSDGIAKRITKAVDGSVFECGVYGTALVSPKDKMIGMRDSHMGITYSFAFEYANGLLVDKGSTWDETGDVANPTPHYKVNGEIVTKDVYDQAKAQFDEIKWAEAGRKYAYDDLSVLS